MSQTKKNLTDRVVEAVVAGFSGIWIKSYEQADAVRAVAAACSDRGWVMMTWDAERGLQRAGTQQPAAAQAQQPGTPLAAIAALRQLELPKPAEGQPSQRGVLIVRNLNWLLSTPDKRVLSPVLVQAVQHLIEDGEAKGWHLVAISGEGSASPMVPELEKMFYLISHGLPSTHELYELACEVEAREVVPVPGSAEGHTLFDAAAGLTRIEAKGAFAMSLTRDDKLAPDTIWELKEETLRKGGLLQMYRPTAGFDQLGGLNHLKEFCLRALKPEHRREGSTARAKGVLVAGLPGSGKSAIAKALGFEVKRPTLSLDIGSLFAGVVGESEDRTRRALATLDAMAPCVCFCDEIEKALAGAGGGARDSGVSDRMFGTFLTWLNDHESDVFVIATMNDPSRLAAASSGAFARAERFDALFFVDLPGREQKDLIWDIYIKAYNLSAELAGARPRDEDWTGAEIKACCRLSDLLNQTLIETARQIVPVAVASHEQITSLKEWAHNRCLSADWKGVYDKNGEPKFMTAEEINLAANRPRRAVTRGKR